MGYFDNIFADLEAKNYENDVREDSEVDHQKDEKENNITNELKNGEPRGNENLNENKEENGLNIKIKMPKIKKNLIKKMKRSLRVKLV